MRWPMVVLAGALGLCACGAPPGRLAGAENPGEDRETAIARSIQEDETITYEAQLSNASFILRDGTVSDSNTGHPCRSGRLVDVRLIGRFPHVDTTGHSVDPLEPVDFAVTAMDFTADATSGEVCLVGVRTGAVRPEPGAVDLPLR